MCLPVRLLRHTSLLILLILWFDQGGSTSDTQTYTSLGARTHTDATHRHNMMPAVTDTATVRDVTSSTTGNARHEEANEIQESIDEPINELHNFPSNVPVTKTVIPMATTHTAPSGGKADDNEGDRKDNSINSYSILTPAEARDNKGGRRGGADSNNSNNRISSTASAPWQSTTENIRGNPAKDDDNPAIKDKHDTITASTVSPPAAETAAAATHTSRSTVDLLYTHTTRVDLSANASNISTTTVTAKPHHNTKHHREHSLVNPLFMMPPPGGHTPQHHSYPHPTPDSLPHVPMIYQGGGAPVNARVDHSLFFHNIKYIVLGVTCTLVVMVLSIMIGCLCKKKLKKDPGYITLDEEFGAHDSMTTHFDGEL